MTRNHCNKSFYNSGKYKFKYIYILYIINIIYNIYIPKEHNNQNMIIEFFDVIKSITAVYYVVYQKLCTRLVI